MMSLFRGVDFAYENRQEATRTEALKDITFTARSGEVTALVGLSGSGKSTVANLIPRFWDVLRGAILIGGVDVRQIASAQLMEMVSFVFQDSFLLFDTLYENIHIGNPAAKREQVITAARAAQCDEFIERIPDGYETVIGNRGVHLSGGEEQQIAVARAILKNAPIFVLDEATAFADPENEYKMRLALKELVKDKTVIMIAHRLSSIISADRIIVLNEGRIVEHGTHPELINQKELYYKLWTIQEKSTEWQINAHA